MLKKLKKDFIGVRYALNQLFGRQLPLGVSVLWYVVTLPIALIMYPFVKLWNNRLMKDLKNYK